MFHSILPPIHSATPCPLLPMAISKSTVQTGNLGNNPPHLLLPQPQETRSACCSLTSPDDALSLPYLPLQPQQQEDSLKTESIRERAGVTNVVVCQEKSDISVSPPPWPAPEMDPSSHLSGHCSLSSSTELSCHIPPPAPVSILPSTPNRSRQTQTALAQMLHRHLSDIYKRAYLSPSLQPAPQQAPPKGTPILGWASTNLLILLLHLLQQPWFKGPQFPSLLTDTTFLPQSLTPPIYFLPYSQVIFKNCKLEPQFQ